MTPRLPNRCAAGLLVLILGLAGCIGIDLVDDPPSGDARIDLSPATAAVQRGDTVRFQATYYDGFGEPRPEVSLQWRSSDPSVAAVDAGGLVLAGEAGQTMISAHTEDAASAPALLTVVSDPSVVAAVVVTPESVELQPGGTQVFTATALNLRGEAIGGKTFTWASSNPDAAPIDDAGRATALQPGRTEITATTDGVRSMPARLTVPGRMRQGTFVKRAGTSYTLSGSVTLEEQPDGSLLLTFSDDFNTSQGPGLAVYLSRTNAVGSGSLSLGALQSVSGGQRYTVSSAVSFDAFDWVIIHCVPFNVTFGYAELQ